MRRCRPLSSIPVLSALALVGCGDADLAEPPSAESAAPPVAATLECVTREIPCTWGDVAQEVRDRGRELGVAADLLLNEAGLAPEEVAEKLARRDEVAEVQVGQTSVRLRLHGGRPIWASRTAIDGELLRSAPGHPRFGPITGAPAVPAAQVVGESGEGKHALILSPYYWEFNDWRVLWEAQQISKVRHYRREDGGTVTVFANAERNLPLDASIPDSLSFKGFDIDQGGTVELEHFQSWDRYDYVHLSTHGDEVCDSTGSGSPGGGRCYTSISAGTRLDPAREMEARYAAVYGAAVEYRALRTVDAPCVSSDADDLLDGLPSDCPIRQSSVDNPPVVASLKLETDFFRFTYPGGLENTIVWLDACESHKNGDLPRALQGKGSYIMGYGTTVSAHHEAVEDVIGFIEHNLGVEDWADSLNVLHPRLSVTMVGGEATRSDRPSTPSGGPAVVASGEGVWPREVVLLAQSGGDEVDHGDTVWFAGVPGDGEPDVLLAEIRKRGPELPGADQTAPVRLEVGGAMVAEGLETPNMLEALLWGGVDTVPLSTDLDTPGPVDVTLEAELERGPTRWTYRDLVFRPANAVANMTVTGARVGLVRAQVRTGRRFAPYSGEDPPFYDVSQGFGSGLTVYVTDARGYGFHMLVPPEEGEWSGEDALGPVQIRIGGLGNMLSPQNLVIPYTLRIDTYEPGRRITGSFSGSLVEKNSIFPEDNGVEAVEATFDIRLPPS